MRYGIESSRYQPVVLPSSPYVDLFRPSYVHGGCFYETRVCFGSSIFFVSLSNPTHQQEIPLSNVFVQQKDHWIPLDTIDDPLSIFQELDSRAVEFEEDRIKIKSALARLRVSFPLEKGEVEFIVNEDHPLAYLMAVWKSTEGKKPLRAVYLDGNPFFSGASFLLKQLASAVIDGMRENKAQAHLVRGIEGMELFIWSTQTIPLNQVQLKTELQEKIQLLFAKSRITGLLYFRALCEGEALDSILFEEGSLDDPELFFERLFVSKGAELDVSLEVIGNRRCLRLQKRAQLLKSSPFQGLLTLVQRKLLGRPNKRSPVSPSQEFLLKEMNLQSRLI